MAATGGAAALSQPLWDEGIWDELLAYVEEEHVVPIIGPAAYPVTVDGRERPLDLHIAEQLALRLSLAADETGDGSLNAVVSAYLRRSRRRERLYPTILDIVQKGRFEPPKILRQLAEIRQFNLYVTTGFDPLIETAINEVRFGGAPRAQAIAYAPNDVHDLDAAKRDLTRPAVYYLLGKVQATPAYVISDDDLLEWLSALQSDSLGPRRLLSELENNHLLIIGGNFPDWVVRLFLRTAKRRRLSNPRDVLEILADDRSGKDAGLVSFLANFSPQTQIFQGDAAAFVETLWQRWRERHGGDGDGAPAAFVPPPREMPEGAIFISYAHEDIDAVRRLKSALDAAGLVVWFDIDRLAGGDSFDLKIHDHIRRCSLFLPVLSQHTEARIEGFFRREWRYALDRDMDIDPGVPFIVPVTIDGTREFATLPPRFRELHVTATAEGEPTAEFIAHLKRIGGRR